MYSGSFEVEHERFKGYTGQVIAGPLGVLKVLLQGLLAKKGP